MIIGAGMVIILTCLYGLVWWRGCGHNTPEIELVPLPLGLFRPYP